MTLVCFFKTLKAGTFPIVGGCPRRVMKANNLKKIRESLLISKAELARKAGLSALTIDRVEHGMECRMDTKRKILLALGLTISDKNKLFP